MLNLWIIQHSKYSSVLGTLSLAKQQTPWLWHERDLKYSTCCIPFVRYVRASGQGSIIYIHLQMEVDVRSADETKKD